MNPKTMLSVSNRTQWRAWLKKNHASAGEVWLVFFKKHTGQTGVEYGDSVEEALCFGWIDGLKRRIDDRRYAYRFSPRNLKSKWSPLNVKLAKKMIKEGKMTEAGLAAFKRRIEYDEQIVKARTAKEIPLTPEMEKMLKSNKKAWENFNKLAPGHRKQFVVWIRSAKRQETMEKRLAESIMLLADNCKLGMK